MHVASPAIEIQNAFFFCNDCLITCEHYVNFSFSQYISLKTGLTFKRFSDVILYQILKKLILITVDSMTFCTF